ncbi:MAG: radical SAM protein [Acidobacteriia bacterium]|nr:radical SAM protein [Terriglobia bacterium]
MRIGILDVLVDSPRTWINFAYRGILKKQYASIVPQAVAVWCRQLGHEVAYAAYYGQDDPKRLLPDDLHLVFLSTYTQSSALAYALAKLYRKEGTLTVIGGPHARSFPADCLRFFDWVVLECDKTLVGDLLKGAFKRNSVITSGRPLHDIPSVEERLPEIEISAFARGRPVWSSIVPLLSSVGCPYACDFCVDWSNDYALLPLDRLEADLSFISSRWPRVMVAYHDPNFGVKFDQVLSVMERMPPPARNPYVMESSLSLLKGPRLRRLKDTRCVYVAPGVESWQAYSEKVGVGGSVGRDRLEQLVARFGELRDHVVGLQANFMFGTDVDRGDEPVELTREFMRRLPFVWPTINIPTPFGGTPLYDRCLAQGRILRSMPFSFYYTPYLVTTLEHYHPVEYYEKLADMYASMTSATMIVSRLLTDAPPTLRALHALRSVAMKKFLSAFRRIRGLLETDLTFRAFHEGRSTALPDYYRRVYERKLGGYASLLSPAERTPELGTA